MQVQAVRMYDTVQAIRQILSVWGQCLLPPNFLVTDEWLQRYRNFIETLVSGGTPRESDMPSVVPLGDFERAERLLGWLKGLKNFPFVQQAIQEALRRPVVGAPALDLFALADVSIATLNLDVLENYTFANERLGRITRAAQLPPMTMSLAVVLAVLQLPIPDPRPRRDRLNSARHHAMWGAQLFGWSIIRGLEPDDQLLVEQAELILYSHEVVMIDDDEVRYLLHACLDKVATIPLYPAVLQRGPFWKFFYLGRLPDGSWKKYPDSAVEAVAAAQRDAEAM